MSYTPVYTVFDVRKAVAPDGVGVGFSKCAKELAGLIFIIKSYLHEREVPLPWKRASIVPVYISGDKKNPLNYRPVCRTSVVCKLCEKIIK